MSFHCKAQIHTNSKKCHFVNFYSLFCEERSPTPSDRLDSSVDYQKYGHFFNLLYGPHPVLSYATGEDQASM